MFVVFEGIDGSGKTTVSSRVAKQLRAAGLSVEHLREGGKFSSTVTQAIREFGRDARNLELTPEAEFFLYVTRDVQLLQEQTRPALGRAEIVIADRFLYSAENLARHGRGLPESWIRPVLDAAANQLVPDLVVWVDIDPHLARARRQVEKLGAENKRPPSRKGLSGVGLQHRLRAGYRAMADRESERWVVIDNDQELDTTVAAITALVHDAAKQGVTGAVQRFRAATPALRKTAEPLQTPEQALSKFVRLIAQRSEREPGVAAYFLSGLFGPSVDDQRRLLANTAPDALLASMRGLDDAVSWELRERLATEHPTQAARSLRGLPVAHPRAAALRAQLRALVPLDVLASYDGCADDEAFVLREALYAAHPALVVGSLTRLDTPQAWALRERFLADIGEAAFSDYECAKRLCGSVAWLEDERAWAWRKAARDVAPIAALGSISGAMNSERAWKWRTRWLPHAPKTVFAGLRHNADARGWPMREQWALLCKEAIDSIQALDNAQAWKLREQHADLWPSTVLKSLGPLCTTPAGVQLTLRQLRRHPQDISLLKHASAIALGVHQTAAPAEFDEP
jgi:dTMP kinase